MKGAEIIRRFERAKKAVAERHGSWGEIGDFMRGRGYLVSYNGFNVCAFGEEDVHLWFSADSCSHPWKISPNVRFGCNHAVEARIADIEPETEYDVPPNLSEVERLERGLIEPKAFGVYSIGPRQFKKVGECNTFAKADELARRMCQDEITRLDKDSVWRRHTPCSVRNDEFRAKERGEFSHYRTYYCDGYDYWIAVRNAEEG